ncbi:G-D-S-L family lipolytic protein [Modestobacter muralis]|uniref:G-D-S-L family lipolytic protein n=1 Tax=Modestobacter muralis TaxID=1608614 RepID=A0A6P0H797_9ACTN|nr:G-D-S-L family lipolytic protein [Modestobacter muralis]NEN51023.1 G-D-S-L family lipolytic protein [Modestobacter muralis]
MSDVRVCAVGDSFVAGVGDPDHLGWVGRLAARSPVPLTSYVLGVRGQTSRQVLARWRAECDLRLPADVDGRVVVSFGVNDTTLVDGVPRVAPADSAAHLAALLADSPWPVLVVGPPPVDDVAQNGRTAGLDAAFAEVCRERGVPYVGVLTPLLASPVWMREVTTGDGAHPGAAGYAELAVLVRPAWDDWIAEPGR